MAYPAFPSLGRTASSAVAPGSQRVANPAVLTAKFGGRYSQRTGDGINSRPRDFVFKSIPLRAADIATLENFLQGSRLGYLPFTYLVPGEATPRQFICSKWQTDYTYPLHWTFTAQFEENFDP